LDDLGFEPVAHSAYALRIILSDFFLFGDVKQRLKWQDFDSPHEIQEAIRKMLGGYRSSTLKKVFDEWIESCNALSK
jgi:hypothetical protein